jgi:hypothetical protein
MGKTVGERAGKVLLGCSAPYRAQDERALRVHAGLRARRLQRRLPPADKEHVKPVS